MGKKSKSKGIRSRKRTSGGTDPEALPASLENAEKLVRQGNVAMGLGKHEAALQIFSAAAIMYDKLRRKSQNSDQPIEILLAKTKCQTGEAYASMGLVDLATQEFRQGISELESAQKNHDLVSMEEVHDVKASLYMYMAQSSEGSEALEFFTKGSQELKLRWDCLKSIKDHVPGTPMPMEEEEQKQVRKDQLEDPEEAIEDVKKRLCETQCAIAELYMTDLCMEDGAEQQCESSLHAALEYCGASIENNQYSNVPPEVLQTMANLRLSQSRLDDATSAILAAYSKIEVGCKALASISGFGDEEDEELEDPNSQKAQELMNTEEVLQLPGQEFRVQTAKLLLECANSLIGDKAGEELGNQCAEAAIQVLGSVLAEMDEIIEVWYLIGSAAMASSPPNYEMAYHHWMRALEMLETCVEQLQNEGGSELAQIEGDEEDQMEMIETQIKNVKERINEIKDKVDLEDEEEN